MIIIASLVNLNMLCLFQMYKHVFFFLYAMYIFVAIKEFIIIIYYYVMHFMIEIARLTP